MLVWVILIAALFIILERVLPDQKLPAVKGWWTRVIIINAIQAVVFFGGVWVCERLFPDTSTSLFALGPEMGAVTGGGVGYFILTFLFYWWHRFRHTANFLWKTCHQLHHSPARIETITSFYKHPLEIFVNGLIINGTCHVILGMTVEQVAWTNLLSAVAEYIYHMNVKTPQWMGYVFQRPEMHRIHHQRGLHFYNFSDIPLWDMLFGTYRNPRTQDRACGFRTERELRLKDILLFQNVNAPPGEQRR